MVQKNNNITVLVAPLDWGLGHATRCIPIIKFLLQSDCNVIIAAEGTQENLLKTEFPFLPFVKLPGYRISYSRHKRFFLLKIVCQLPKILLTIRKENKWLKSFVHDNQIDAVISDNRYGLYHVKVPSVFITHQLLIKAPSAIGQKLLQRINYRFIQKFSRCWVPDEKGTVNLAGTLSHPDSLPKLNIDYLGGISRLEKSQNLSKKWNLLIVISGPEPHRTLLEEKMLTELIHYSGEVLLIRGLPGNTETPASNQNIEVENHLSARELEKAFANAEYIISRSGYTTVMDICKLQKKSVLIPTPGQTEQEYLAAHLQQQRWCLAINQDDFSLPEALEQAKRFDYQLPDIDMEKYKSVITEFIKTI